MGSSQSARSFEVLDSQATPKKENRADCKVFENREMNFKWLLQSVRHFYVAFSACIQRHGHKIQIFTKNRPGWHNLFYDDEDVWCGR